MSRNCFLLWLMLISATMGQELRIEYAQQGDPEKPRALIVVHDLSQSREDLGPFLKSWGTLSWARAQYCSVYSYTYPAEPEQVNSFEAVADSLLRFVLSNRFTIRDPDEVNPYATSEGFHGDQPDPSLRGEEVEFILVGQGFGGLVARKVCAELKRRERKVRSVGYLATPLDGLSTFEIVALFTQKERIQQLGYRHPFESWGRFRTLSPGLWQLAEVRDPSQGYAEGFNPANEVAGFGVFGNEAKALYPQDNAMYGRHSPVTSGGFDGLMATLTQFGPVNGPASFTESLTLKQKPGVRLLKEAEAHQFIYDKVIDQKTIFEYLERRLGIEESYRGEDNEPLGTYYDERPVAQWRNAYAPPDDLYKLMWGVGP